MFSFRLAAITALASASLLGAPILPVMAGHGGGGGHGGGHGGGFGGGFGGRGGYGRFGGYGYGGFGYGYGGFGYGYGGFYPGYGYGYGGFYPGYGYGYGGFYPGYGYGGYGAIYSGYGGLNGCGCAVGQGSAPVTDPSAETASAVAVGRPARYVDYYSRDTRQVTRSAARAPASRYVDYYTRKPVAPTILAVSGSEHYLKYNATEPAESSARVIQAGSTVER